jgi:hypothetical protein
LWITIALIAFDAEKRQKGVAVVASTFGAWGGSCGALPDTCPMARSSTASPR